MRLVARRVLKGETLEDVPVEEVGPGDLVLVRSGEVVPADGMLEDDEAVIDESALTGEALPVVTAADSRFEAAP